MSSGIVCVDYHSKLNWILKGYTMALSCEGKVFTFGNCETKSNGLEKDIVFPPQQISSLVHIKMISCRFTHSICLDYDGNVYSFGNNDEGQLGINEKLKNSFTPLKIDIPPCKKVSCGNYFTICLSEEGILYSFGENFFGQLGFGNNVSCSTPQQIPLLSNVVLVSCGLEYVVCKIEDGRCYSWGNNEYGQLGIGDGDTCYTTPYHCSNWPEDIIDIKCGNYHSLILTSSGEIYSCGLNRYGQIGVDNDNDTITSLTLIKEIPTIIRIECASYSCLCIDSDNQLWVFGKNENGQLGLGDKESRYKPTLNESFRYIIDISSGGDHTFVKTVNNEIYAFGCNTDSQLGITTSERHQPIPIQVFKDNEDIWGTSIRRSKQKSARK